MKFSVGLYFMISFMIYYYIFDIPKRQTRTLASDVKPQRIKQKDTKFRRFLLAVFAEEKGSYKIVIVYRKIGFALTAFMCLILILILSGNNIVANNLLYCLLVLIIMLSIIRAVLVFAAERYSGIKHFRQGFAAFKNTFCKISKQDFMVYRHYKFNDSLNLRKELEKYCYTKEKGVLYLQYKDLDRIKSKELNKYKKFDYRIEQNEKAKQIFEVFDKKNGEIIFQAPIKM